MNTSSKCLLTTAMVSTLSLAAHGAAATLPTPPTQFLPVGEGHIAYDDTGGHSPLVLAIPGMGDLRAFRMTHAA